jgi:hypothetical protein
MYNSRRTEIRLENGRAAPPPGQWFFSRRSSIFRKRSLENFWAHLLFASWNDFLLSEEMIFCAP